MDRAGHHCGVARRCWNRLRTDTRRKLQQDDERREDRYSIDHDRHLRHRADPHGHELHHDDDHDRQTVEDRQRVIVDQYLAVVIRV
jgi:ABC-type nickel/cobalt efflux system permease component RcnA